MTLFQGILKIVANKDKCDDALPQKKFLAPFIQFFSKKNICDKIFHLKEIHHILTNFHQNKITN
jgi:hypothetical protein